LLEAKKLPTQLAARITVMAGGIPPQKISLADLIEQVIGRFAN
jgi:hypothetical protein